MFVQSMVIFLLAPPLLEALTWDDWIWVGSCRANCVGSFLDWPPSDNACHAADNCSQCWDLCELLQTDDQWRHLCRPAAAHLCVPGCREACRFPTDRFLKSNGERWRFTRHVNFTRDWDHRNLRAEWYSPQRQNDVTDNKETTGNVNPYFVYSIIEEIGESSHWTVLYMGVNTSADIVAISGGEEQYGRFRLLAFHESGLAAEQTVPGDTNVLGDDDESSADYSPNDQANDLSTDYAVHRSPAGHYYHADPRQPVDIDTYDDIDVGTDAPSFNITVLVEPTRLGTLRVQVMWTLPEDDAASPSSSGEDGVSLCTVNWARYSCNVDRGYPSCEIPNDHFDVVRTVEHGQEVEYILPGITFNSHYWVSVEAAGINSRRVDFYTPGCATPTASYVRCLQTFPDASIDTDPPWSANITCVDPEVDNKGSLRMRLQWSAPQLANGQLPTVYRVTYMGMTPYGDTTNNVVSVDATKTTNTSVTLHLSVNVNYDITITAEMGPKSDSMTLWSTTHRHVETSQLLQSAGKDLPICTLSSRQPTVTTRDPGSKAVPLLLIIMCSLLGVAMVTCVSLLICRKWRHLQANIITHKVMVAKNNIYNSVPERSDEFSGVEQQLLLVGDEWELDPREIQLGSELGHGAFGKVYTGFYRDTKVAIKVMKEEMPAACKDDLLCEIALMKKVGSHPNIVSLLGACTLCRPIALIMEFMPFGNLERFLQKCKLEGELQKKDDDVYSVTYAMVNDFGDTEQWVVTSKDMLSFARQVAQAMEYLSARECVHRDLAARNVLIGHGKVVKVCDFGLARVMGSEGGYQKRSSGKLPLKWLALETLRGYVHTTYSDVWSYGILLWEIVTMGACPYSDIALADLYTVLSNGYRMEQPRNCSDELYDVISQCWYENPKDRPTFTQLRMRIEGLLARQENYLELCNIGSAGAEA